MLAIAKLEPHKTNSHYQAQIKTYLEYIADAEEKAEAFAFYQERMQENMTTEAPRLKEMSREFSERLCRFGGTWSQKTALGEEAMNHIRLAPDREQAFAEVSKGMDMALEKNRGWDGKIISERGHLILFWLRFLPCVYW